ncbi:hypothetical protein DL98DRAFT_567951 [Cadophora sp. DSE1049]|nr:hypothetical protein DL98DRAFT_567951 [Cadophora sp. DSE1049]
MSSSSTSTAAPLALSQITCNICKITFENNTLQRTHAKSDWHIYNLKRQLTSLPPISYQIHNERVASVPTAEDEEIDDFHQSCTTCKKDFYKSKTYQKHLKSTNHAQAIAKLQSQNDSEPEESEGDEDASPNDAEDLAHLKEDSDSFPCLFCPHPSTSLPQNLTHMHTTHNFTIPHQTSLIDLPTFITYLSTLITIFHECLYCGQNRDTTASIMQHMLDKGHCRLADDAVVSEELGEFWEFEEDKEVDEEGMVDVDVRFEIDRETKELHLASGRTLGHRSNAHQFRQNHIPPKDPNQKAIEGGISSSNNQSEGHAAGSETSLSTPTNKSDRRAVMALTRSENANKGLIGLSELEKRAVRATEKKMLKMEVRARNLYAARVERGANRQKYFKPDVPGPKNG